MTHTRTMQKRAKKDRKVKNEGFMNDEIIKRYNQNIPIDEICKEFKVSSKRVMQLTGQDNYVKVLDEKPKDKQTGLMSFLKSIFKRERK